MVPDGPGRRTASQALAPVKPLPAALPATESGAGVLATKVRALRVHRELTLRDLSKRTGMSPSALSKIENGLLSPTYEKIVALANGLEVDVSELFTPVARLVSTGRRGVTRKGQGVAHRTPRYDYEMLCADVSDKQFVPLTARIKAHAIKEFPHLPRHDGEEFVYILKGEVWLHCEFYEPLRLGEGDSCYFDSSMGHAFVSGTARDAELLWVCSRNVKLPKRA
ncbi:MAG: XRE family transcriptional regulator [Betaproteobacteria bacterium]|nr:XRE family transcriptional regulator [Betaproteobacteria bacterium]